MAGRRNVKTARVSSPLDTSAERPLWLEPATAPTPTAVAVIMMTFVNVDKSGNTLPFVIVQICLMYNATISRKQNNVVLKVTDRPVRPRVSTLLMC